MKTNKSTLIKKRCAIYTRKSTEEGLEMEFNSLDAQRESCEAYILSQKQEGWELLPEQYNDGGFSGGNLSRPALTRLLDDIRQGNIDTIVVYKVDRLSRSLADFAKLVELFEAQHVSFVSITQHFNTTTSMGRLTLNILLSFAQFEREVIGERVRDKFAASKRKGMWMGGVLPLGYDVKDRHLHSVDSEARTIRAVFDLFLKTKSPTMMVKQLSAMGVCSKQRTTKAGRTIGGVPLDIGSIYKLLKNPLYIGKIKHKDTLYQGRHEAIISQEIWDKTQAILREGAKRGDTEGKRRARAVLTGIIHCGGCQRAMTPTHTSKQHRKLYRYYIATGYKKGRCPDCPIKQIAANEIETHVLHQVQRVITSPDILLDTLKAAKTFDKSITPSQVRNALQNIAPIWQELFPTEQQRLLSLLINRIVLHSDYVDIQVNINGITGLLDLLHVNTHSTEKTCQPQP